VKPELVALIKSMVAVKPEERPERAMAEVEEICMKEFAFFQSVDPVAVRVELAKIVVDDEFEGKPARVKRETVELRAKTGCLQALLTGPQLLEFRVAASEAENAVLIAICAMAE
jgi:hypothetical protein